MILGGKLWGNPDFIKMWSGQTVSQFGTWITQLALPSVLILQLHGGPFQVGLLTTLQFLAFPVLGLPAGVLVDRLPRRSVMIAADLGRVVTLGSIPVAGVLSSLTLPHLYVAAVLTGVLTVFFDVAYQAYLPSLVERKNLVEGNTKLELSRSVAQVAGPLIAGLLIQLVGAARVIAIDAVSYLVSVISLVVIRAPEPTRAPPAGHFMGQLVEGLRVVFGNRTLATIAGCTSTWNLGGNMFFAVFLIFAYSRLHLSPGAVGIIFGAASLGGVVGALVSGRVSRRLGLGPTLAASGLVAGIAYLGMPLALVLAPLPLLMALSFVQGMQLPIYNITQLSLRQSLVSNQLQGRMNATMRTIVWGALPLGALLGGVLGTAIGVVPTMLAGGVLSALSTIWVLAGPLIRLREPPTQEERG